MIYVNTCEFYSKEQSAPDKTEATEKLLAELEKGKRSGEEQGYLPASDIAAEFTETE